LPIQPARSASEKQNGRLSLGAQGKQGSKIGIRRHYDSIFSLGSCEYRVVFGRLKSVLAHMDGVVADSLERCRNSGRKRIIHQEFH